MQPSAPSTLKIGNRYAEIVIGSLQAGRAMYTLDGAPVDIDVTIPEDLAAHWYWHGPILVYRAADRVGLSICADTFGVAGAFEQARWFMAQDQKHAERAVQLAMF